MNSDEYDQILQDWNYFDIFLSVHKQKLNKEKEDFLLTGSHLSPLKNLEKSLKEDCKSPDSLWPFDDSSNLEHKYIKQQQYKKCLDEQIKEKQKQKNFSFKNKISSQKSNVNILLEESNNDNHTSIINNISKSKLSSVKSPLTHLSELRQELKLKEKRLKETE